MNLNGSVFLKVTAYDAFAKKVTCELGEQPDHLNRALDYHGSKANFAHLAGTDLHDMGKAGAVGKICDVECDDAKKRIFVTAKIDDPTIAVKVEKGVFKGMQCRVYADEALKYNAPSYVAAPGALSLVDAPFDNATQLRKVRDQPDPVDALTAALNAATAVMNRARTATEIKAGVAKMFEPDFIKRRADQDEAAAPRCWTGRTN